eukprot:gene21119-13099_t
MQRSLSKPLLGGAQEHEMPAKKEGLSRLTAAFNIVKCNWGIGMMAMPYIAFERKDALSEAKVGSINPESLEPGPQTTRKVMMDYTGLMTRALGPFGDWAALFCIVLSSYGSNIAYIKFIQDNLYKFFPHAFSSPGAWLAITLAPLFGLSIADNISFLAPFSLFGLFCAFSFGTLVVYNTGSTLSPTEFSHIINDEPFIKPKTMLTAVSIAAFCNEGIVVLSPSTQNAMREPSKYLWTAMWSIVFFFCCYMAVGIAGNVLYCKHVDSDLSLNFAVNATSSKAAVVLYSLQLIPSYAVVFYCAYEACENKFMRLNGITNRWAFLKANPKKRILYVLNRFAFVGISAIIAYKIKNFGEYLALIGALANSLAIYVMPQLCYLRIVAPKEKRSWKRTVQIVGSWLLVLFGVALAVFGTYQSAKGLFGHAAKHPSNNYTNHSNHSNHSSLCDDGDSRLESFGPKYVTQQ